MTTDPRLIAGSKLLLHPRDARQDRNWETEVVRKIWISIERKEIVSAGPADFTVGPMPSVLVSGEENHVHEVAQALRRRGATVTEVTDLADVSEVCHRTGDGTFDSYVQLAAALKMEGDSAVARVRHFYADGVLARFSALDAARRSLATPASVVFVLGTLPDEVTTDDDRNARAALTGVLGRAVRSDAAPGELTVRVLGADSEPDRVAALALGQAPPPRDEPRLAELSLEDWRLELMSVALAET